MSNPTTIETETAGGCCAPVSLLARVTWQTVWDRLPPETRRHLSAHDGMMIRDMVRRYVQETISEMMAIPAVECPSKPTDNFLWGYRSACMRITDKMMASATLEHTEGERANAAGERLPAENQKP